jgi:CrcB protein
MLVEGVVVAAGSSLRVAAPRTSARDVPRDVVAAVSAGGVLGALGRYAVSEALPHEATEFPWSTLLVNLSGCLLIGILMVVVLELTAPHRLVRPFLGVGVLGGYTTFSTASVETYRLLDGGEPALGFAYLAASVCGAVAAVWVGMTMARAGDRLRTRGRKGGGT